jgi:hypothetical protein
MALTPHSGSSTTPSSRNTLPNDIPNSQSDNLMHMPFIADGSLNKHAIDVSQYADTTRSLIGFMKGKRIAVTYYRQMKREGSNNRTNISDSASVRNSLNSEYHKILNLEITLEKGFEFTTNTAQTSVQITGQAQFYPNMNPFIGDMFLVSTGDGRMGVCRITSTTPMSWRDDTIYLVEFMVHEFVSPANHDPIEGAVTQVSVFRKENYLGGTAALLSEQTYVQLLSIKETRRNLIRFFHQSFFDTNIRSYLRPDGKYDPWLVQFISGKITMNDIPIRPKNLLGKVGSDYASTLWARLEDRYNSTMYLLSPYVKVESYRQDRLSVFVSELYNRGIIYPTEDADAGEPYLYTPAFYKGLVNEMTAEEKLMFDAVTLRTTGDLSILITNYLDTVMSLSKDLQFYKIPLYIHLIDMSLQSKYREADAPSMNYASTADRGE